MLYHMPRLLTATLALALGGSLATAPAYARMVPNPPPSGIVIHLFGPNSVTSHILPTAPSAQTPGAAPTANGTQAAGPSTAAGSGPTPAPAPGPTWGDVAHQMFVTGDPAQENANALAKGKAGH